jgi:hypothetical protein
MRKVLIGVLAVLMVIAVPVQAQDVVVVTETVVVKPDCDGQFDDTKDRLRRDLESCVAWAMASTSLYLLASCEAEFYNGVALASMDLLACKFR